VVQFSRVEECGMYSTTNKNASSYRTTPRDPSQCLSPYVQPFFSFQPIPIPMPLPSPQHGCIPFPLFPSSFISTIMATLLPRFMLLPS
jgi:hypothetical protein